MLIDAYIKVMASERLLPLVKYHAFGDQTELDKVATAPRVIWIPSTGAQASPDMIARVPCIVNGRRSIVTSIAMVKRGVDIYFFTDYGPDGQRQMEWLLNEFQIAVHEIIRSIKGNYELDSEQWYPRKGLSVKTTEVKLPARFFVPIWSAEPAAIVRKVTTTLTPITES